MVCNHPTKPLLIKNGYPLTKCPNCDLVAMDPQPTPAILEEFYSPQTGYHAAYSDAFIARQRHEFTLRITEALPLLSSARVRVLDIGAANGLFLDCAKEHGWQTEGVEMNSANIPVCEQKGHRMTHGSFDDYTNTGESFNVVHMGDVIEHMLDPREAVRKSAQLLSSGGLLIIATPDASAPFPKASLVIAKALHLSWPHALPPAHTFQFSINNLDTLLEQEGFAHVHSRFLSSGFMEEMRETEYFQTIYQYLKRRKGSLGRFLVHTALFCVSAVVYFPLWAVSVLLFAINRHGAHVTAWYVKR